ncbi:hypothetical protein [Primorskyibacter sp. S187A]|uniref:hypothetical protein n=1 Tax=Primorskyibacter sp. S187A TaxID=3415130 RepID=UPI003C7BA4CB
MTRTDLTARAIAQDLLDKTGQAMLKGDFDTFRRYFTLPHHITTYEGQRTLETIDDLHSVFEGVVAAHASDGVTRLERWVEAANWVDQTTIRHTHVASRYAGDRLLRGPHPSISILKLEDGVWRISESQYAIHDWPKAQSAFMTEAQQRAEIDCAAILRTGLDAITRAYMERDFGLLCEHVSLPLYMHGPFGRVYLTTRAELRSDFDLYDQELASHGVTEVVRKIKSAELIAKDRIMGSYLSFVLSGTELVVPSYKSFMTLERDADNHWRMCALEKGLGHLSHAAQASPSPQEVIDD